MPRTIRKAVYVDSGSTDGSPDVARSLGVEVVALDLSVQFTAARARNAGFDRLLELAAEVEYVQFVDGDCEVDAGLIRGHGRIMTAGPDVVVVCGRRRERHPERRSTTGCATWSGDGPARATPFGGDALMRASALKAVGGYRPDVIAGEDAELGVRLRRAGGRRLRIAEVSTLHDAAMTRLGQWWTAVRARPRFRRGVGLHGGPPVRYFVREARRTLSWGLAVPAVAAALRCPAWPVPGATATYTVQALGITRGRRRRGSPCGRRPVGGLLCGLEAAESLGVIRYRRKCGRADDHYRVQGAQPMKGNVATTSTW